MPTDAYLKLGDIKGESPDDKHKDEIEILSWSFGLAQPGGMHLGTGGGVGRAAFQDITFTHYLDKASPVLMATCASGEHIKEATLTMRKAGKGQQEYLVAKLTEVLITSVNVSGSGSGGERPMENFSLSFAKIDLEYKPQKQDGSLDAGVHFKYDVKANKEA